MANWDKELRDLIENVPVLEIVREKLPQGPICWEPPPPSPEELAEAMKNVFPELCNRGKNLVH